MSYTKQNFVDGQVLKAANLNAMDDVLFNLDSEITITPGGMQDVITDLARAEELWTAGLRVDTNTYTLKDDIPTHSAIQHFPITPKDKLFAAFDNQILRYPPFIFFKENNTGTGGGNPELPSLEDRVEFNGKLGYWYTIPEETTYMHISTATTWIEHLNLYLIRNQMVPTKVEIPNFVYNGPQNRLSNKTLVCFGDSITGNMDAPNDYPSVIAQQTGMTVINAGFGGCRMSKHSSDVYDPFCMHALADAVTSNDWTAQDAQVGSLGESTNASEHLTALKAVDWANVDFVTIAYGTNDITGGAAIDSESDKKDIATYLGAARYSLEKLLTKYPHLKIMLLTPTYRYFLDESKDSDEKTFGENKYTDFGDGLITVAEEFKIPVIDMYRTLGFNKFSRTYYFPVTDGTHPNGFGLKLIAGKIIGKLSSEY